MENNSNKIKIFILRSGQCSGGKATCLQKHESMDSKHKFI